MAKTFHLLTSKCVVTCLTLFSTVFVSRQDLHIYHTATEYFSNLKCSQGKRWLQNRQCAALIRFTLLSVSLRLIWIKSSYLYPRIGSSHESTYQTKFFARFIHSILYLNPNIVLNSSFSNSQNLSNSHSAKTVSRPDGQCRWWISSPGNFANSPYIVSLVQISPSAFTSQTHLIYGVGLNWGKMFDACLKLNQKIIRPYEYIWVLYIMKYIHEP
jgi:hypothetical protein